MTKSKGAMETVAAQLQDVTEGVAKMAEQRGRGLAERIERIEGERGLDEIAERVGDATSSLLSNGQLQRLLSGEWLGHPLHPALTDVPIGAWSSATLIDLFGGAKHRGVAQGLTIFGLLSAIPTVAAGLAEYRKIDDVVTRRVAVAHASCNAATAGLYAASLVTRPRFRLMTSTIMVGAGLLGSVAGWLGGHLAFASDPGQGGSESNGTDLDEHSYETATQPLHGMSVEVSGETPAPGTTPDEFVGSGFVGE